MDIDEINNEITPDSELQPWEQQPGEDLLWFGRFKEYLQQGIKRRVTVVYRADLARRGKKVDPSKPSQQTWPLSWSLALKRHSWRARALAWDQAEQVRKDQEWAEAREAERQKELALAVQLRDKAEVLLKLPVLTQEVKHDHNGQEIAWLLVPEFRAFTAASAMLMDAKNHARAALEMPDKFDRKDVGGAVEVDINVRLTPEERFDRIMAIARQARTAGDG